MAKVKLIMLMALSGASGSLKVGEEVEVDEATAVRYIKGKIAKAESKKVHNDLMGKHEKMEEQRLEREAQAKALLEKEALQNELTSLYTDVIKKEAQYQGILLEEKEVLAKVEELLKRVEGK